MRDKDFMKRKISWPKILVKKWFNFRSRDEDFHVDDIIAADGVDEEWTNSCSQRGAFTSKKSLRVEMSENSTRVHTDRIQQNNIKLDPSQITDMHNYRIFVATWNVAGKSPPSYLNLEEWLHASPPADIYVLGFQEIVPLNAGNVLGSEDNGPAKKWLALVGKTLNSLPGISCSCRTTSPVLELDDEIEGSNREKASSFLHRRSFHSLSHGMRMVDNDIFMQQPRLDCRFSVHDRMIYGNKPIYYYGPNVQWDGTYDEKEQDDSFYMHCCSPVSYNGSVSVEERDRLFGKSRYCLVASKQMVGIFLMVWINSDLRDAVHNLKVSCVGRGLMGYLGNKGSISMSMSLYQTNFCFICSHLTSGEKDRDEHRRNSDVIEILKKTRFPQVDGMGNDCSPQTILEHDRIIWLGDLNYRISLSYQCAKALVEMRNWKALLENDQLWMEHRQGRVFAGWNEGNIYFPPTYKYSNNSDRYAGEDVHPKEKRRTPAWCDRILWHGCGLQQLSYVRAESRFSDHRPVYSIFLAEVESISRSQLKNNLNNSSARVEFEELLPYLQG